MLKTTKKSTLVQMMIWTIIALICDGVGVVLDLVLIGIVVGPLLNITYIAAFALYLLLRGDLTWRRLWWMLGSLIGEIIPFVNALPFLTGLTLYIFFDIIKQEKLPSPLTKLV